MEELLTHKSTSIDYRGMSLTADTYKDIDSITKGELMERLEVDFPSPVVEFMGQQLDYTGRAKIMINVSKWLGLDLDNEQFMFVMVESDRLLCEAGAGSGKTTVSQLRLIKEKLFYGMKDYHILSLAYNNHAARDMADRHSEMAEQIINKTGDKLKALQITPGITASTFHSMALGWMKEFPEEFGIKYTAPVEIKNRDGSSSYAKDTQEWKLSEKEAYDGMRAAFKAVQRLFGFEQEIHESQIYKIRSFNSLMQETLTAKDKWIESDSIKEIRLPKLPHEFFQKNPQYKDIDRDSEKVLILSEVLSAFEKYKKLKKKIEFTDVISKFTQKLYNDEEFRKRIHKAYPVILVDEYQDFTTVMTTALQLMVGPNTKLIAIGDGDQSIYGFRGTDPFNCLKFKNMFTTDLTGGAHNPVVTTLGTNRRCDEEIVLTAKRVIESNTLRYDKEIKSHKKGGSVRHKLMHSTTEQANYIVECVKNKTMEQLNETYISYRNRETSMIASRILFENHIPFRIGSGYEPYSDKLSMGIMDIYYMLLYPTNPTRQKDNLWKMLPTVTAAQVRSIVGDNPDEYNPKAFWELNFEQFHNISGFLKALTALQQASQQITSDAPMSNITETVFSLYYSYYWDMQKKSQAFPEELEGQVKEYFNSNKSFSDFLTDHFERIERLEKMKKYEQGVYLTTFHGLKGLECDEHFIMDLEDNIFPGLSKEAEMGADEHAIQLLREESARLLYVAITRARHSLHMLWDAVNPSEFQSIVMCEKEVTNKQIEKVLGSTVLSVAPDKVEEIKEPTKSLPPLTDLPKLDSLPKLPPLTELKPLPDLNTAQALPELHRIAGQLPTLPKLDKLPPLTATVQKTEEVVEDKNLFKEVKPDVTEAPKSETLTVEVSKPQVSKLNSILKGIKKLS